MAHFRLDADRRLFCSAMGFVRLALSRHSDVDPRNWRFCLGPHGRPEIATPPSRLPAFTLSHTRGLTGCAVRQDQDIGLDVEDTSCGDSIDVANQFLSTREMLDYLPTCRRSAQALFRVLDAQGGLYESAWLWVFAAIRSIFVLSRPARCVANRIRTILRRRPRSLVFRSCR